MLFDRLKPNLVDKQFQMDFIRIELHGKLL